MRDIFVVFGNEGSHEDYSEWMVRAFLTKERAEEHSARCRERNSVLEQQEMAVRETPEFQEALATIHAAPVDYSTHTWSQVNAFWELPENKALQDRFRSLNDGAARRRSKDTEMNSLDPSYARRGEYGNWPEDYEVKTIILDE